MKLMKALVYDRPSVCTVRELPVPECGDDEVVIKVMAASICKGAPHHRPQAGPLSHHHGARIRRVRLSGGQASPGFPGQRPRHRRQRRALWRLLFLQAGDVHSL